MTEEEKYQQLVQAFIDWAVEWVSYRQMIDYCRVEATNVQDHLPPKYIAFLQIAYSFFVNHEVPADKDRTDFMRLRPIIEHLVAIGDNNVSSDMLKHFQEA
jgi:hypothetical protein